MNRIILMGRLTKDPEVRYGGANNTAVAKYTLAVDRRFKREKEPDADFITCVSFGKAGEFVEKYLRKGTKVVVEGELQNNNWTDKDGNKRYDFQVVTSGVEFAESKKSDSQPAPSGPVDEDGFMQIPEGFQEELPFN